MSSALGIGSDEFFRELPIYSDSIQLSAITTELLWDRLYSNLAKFIAELIRDQKPALARLVQVYGFFQAEKIVGKKVWRLFPEYRTFIIPVRRQQLDILWNSQIRLGLI